MVEIVLTDTWKCLIDIFFLCFANDLWRLNKYHSGY